MAALYRRLAVVLVMAAWVAASIQSGSPNSGWWASQAYQLRQAAKQSIAKADFAEAQSIYLGGVELARRHHDKYGQSWFWNGVGDARLSTNDFRGAVEAYLEAKQLGERVHDPALLGATDADLASTYEQMGDVESARRSAEEAQRITRNLASIYYRPQLLFLLGRLRGDESSPALYQKGIEAARKMAAKDSSYRAVEANGWDFLCEARLQSGDLEAAEAAAQQGLLLRQTSGARDIGYSDWHLAAVRLRQAAQASETAAKAELLRQAENFNRAAEGARRGPFAYQLTYQRGRILLAQGRTREGLDALEQAIDQTQRWRLSIVPAVTAIDGASSQLQSRIFNGFIQAAADYALESHESRWAAESLEAVELNRTLNLRDTRHVSRRRSLPSQYWQTLAKLQAEEGRLARSRVKSSALSDRLRLELTELEEGAGVGYSPKIVENFPSQVSLSLFQASLTDSDVFLSVALGDTESLLWAVTRNTLHLYRLPPADQIVDAVRTFRKTVESNSTDLAHSGQRLYRMLFQPLAAAETSKQAWQLSVDEALLEVPFSALVVEQSREGPVFLAGKHSLEIRTGALWPARPAPPPRGGLLAVGDPVYNAADTRNHSGSHPLPGWFVNSSAESGGQLSRLPGTRREIEAVAAVWNRHETSLYMPAVLLEGTTATRASFLHALHPTPQIIHLATHAFTAPSGDDAYLAFGLGQDGQPEMLSTAQIRGLRVPGSVVVMTGCDTAPKGAPAGLGLAGLVRAWIVAGASAVLATEWPVQDGAADALLPDFYRYKLASPRSTADAVRLAQVESMTANAAPSVWAAYQVFAGSAP